MTERTRTRLLLAAASVACLLLASPRLAASAAAETAGNDHGYEVLHSFSGSDGANPWNTVAKDGSGDFVGTTYGGGANGFGTVYKIASDGTLTTLYNFKGGADGQNPESLPRLTVDKAGNIFGTTSEGGANSGGTVFKITPKGAEKVLYSFTGGSDGFLPYGGVTLEKKTGNLYGTTYSGAKCCGTVYKLTPDGTLTTLTDDVWDPANGLIEDNQHNVYGTSSYYTGQVFKVAPDGTETIMYNFLDQDDGALPYSALIQDTSGNLYGTTDEGGVNGGGTIFEISPRGLETTLYSFTGSYGPFAHTLLMDKNGNLYSTTSLGSGSGCGGGGCGSVFELTTAGKFVTLHTFTGGSDGGVPYEGLTHDGEYLYGTTSQGGGSGCGGSGCGTVFRLKV